MNIVLTSVEFRNYKAFNHFSLSFQDINILVGPNNCGKSTIIGAFRFLAAGLRRARSQNPERVIIGGDVSLGYPIPTEQLDISIENVHTDYAETDTSISFRLSNGNKLHIFFPRAGGCFLVPEAKQRRVASPTSFRAEFPVSVVVVPVLGPLEHDEAIVKPATVQRNLQTHRASRHFRNFWFYYPDGFQKFANLVSTTWPGMQIERPEQSDDKMVMFCRENRITRELFWSGFGFQIWCQLLTHVANAKDDSILIVDEPEIYLHPDVQRQLLGIFRTLGPAVVIATHSTEIMSEADPSEIVLVDKTSRSAQRLKDAVGVQAVMEQIGSLQNITLTRLARSRRVLFVEGDDFAILTRFARIVGLQELAAGTDIVAISIEGFCGWERIRNIAWGVNRTLGTSLEFCVVLDRDYYPDEEIEAVRASLAEHATVVHIHHRKELENYLLVPTVIERSIKMAMRSTGAVATGVPTAADIEIMLDEITQEMKTEVVGQCVAKRCAYLRSSGDDQATLAAQAIESFESRWNPLGSRLTLVPGKQTLKNLRQRIQDRYGITLTVQRIVSAFRKEELADDLRDLLTQLDNFRKTATGAHVRSLH